MNMGFFYRPISLLIVLVVLAGVASCGQTGDLYLPPEDEQEADGEDE